MALALPLGGDVPAGMGPAESARVWREESVMKKVVLFALLLAAAVASVHAQSMPPLENRYYYCDYTNPTGGEQDPGLSRFRFVYLNTPTDKRGIEDFQATWGWDNRKIVFAKPLDIVSPLYGYGTRWEFTINPSGPQCKNTSVFYGGALILFKSCSDGHTRTCWVQ